MQVGDQIISAEYGPLTLIDTVRWAGVQENLEEVHFDREFARENSRMHTFIASGAYRQALLMRALSERLGPRSRPLRLRVRHIVPTLEGDTLRYAARVTETSKRADGTVITFEVEGKNQKDVQILVGTCVVLVP